MNIIFRNNVFGILFIINSTIWSICIVNDSISNICNSDKMRSNLFIRRFLCISILKPRTNIMQINPAPVFRHSIWVFFFWYHRLRLFFLRRYSFHRFCHHSTSSLNALSSLTTLCSRSMASSSWAMASSPLSTGSGRSS